MKDQNNYIEYCTDKFPHGTIGRFWISTHDNKQDAIFQPCEDGNIRIRNSYPKVSLFQRFLNWINP